MPGPPWGEDARHDEPVIAANVARLLTEVVHTATARVMPTAGLAHSWHRKIYQGVGSVPKPTYLGQPRGCSDPDLVDYEVILANRHGVIARGVPAADVAAELARFQRRVQAACRGLDTHIQPGLLRTDPSELLAIIQLAAFAHGEWVRIHPYANGNGRTARVWANWVATRYELPPFVRIKPRPDGLLYGQAARESMGTAADHTATVSLFLDLLRQRP